MVSICIATYNAEEFIRYTLNSILAQTYQDFEVVIVDDYSTDNTINIIANEYCLKDKRFKLYANVTNYNLPYIDAFNKSLSFATGDLLFRMDHDDIMLPKYLESVVDYMKAHPKTDGCSTELIFYNLEEENKTYETIDYENIPERLYECNYVEKYNKWIKYYNNCPVATSHFASYLDEVVIFHNPSSCLRKSAYDKYKPEFRFLVGGDVLFWKELLSKGAKLEKINDHNLIYIFHNVNAHLNFRTLDILNRIDKSMEDYYSMSKIYLYYVTYYTYSGLNKYSDNFMINETDTAKDLREIMYITLEKYKEDLLNDDKYNDIPNFMKI